MKLRHLPILFFIFVICQHSARAEYFTITNYLVNIRLVQNGDIEIENTIDVRFDTLRRGIFLRIPTTYVVDGEDWKIRISDVLVEGWDFRTYSENGHKIVRIGHPDKFVDGLQKYKISYTASNGYLWHGQRPEFYWNLVGIEWEVPIEHIQYEIIFHESWSIASNEYKIFTGKQGESQISVGMQKEKNRIFGESTRAFGPGEGLSAAILLPEGVIVKPSFKEKMMNSLKKQSWSIPIPLIIAALFFGLWKNFGTNQKTYGIRPSSFYPPRSMSASEAGLFIDNTVNSRDLIALIPEWGNKGIIKVLKSPETDKKLAKEIWIKRTGYLPADAPEYQLVVFDEMFSKGDLVNISDLQNKMYKTMQKAGHLLKKSVRSKNFYDPLAYKIFHSGWMFLVFFVMMFAGISIMVFFGQYISGVFAILIGITAFIVHFVNPKRTPEGYKIHQKLKSFKDFLKQPPGEKMSKLFGKDNGYFDKVYPYVVAFGIDKIFHERAVPHMNYAPAWYYWHSSSGPKTSQPSFVDFTEGFQSQTIMSAFTSFPAGTSGGSTPGSSGGTGGGGAGGGFGGGGGGSW